jgi:hypothetical protein
MAYSRNGTSSAIRRTFVLCAWLVCLACFASAQQGKNAPAKASLTGRYEGSAKDQTGSDITVKIDLVEKDGSLTGNISSSRGDFAISGGSHQGENVTLNFDAGEAAGTISLKIDGDKLVGSWSAGDNSGPVEVKRTAAPDNAPKVKS